MLEVYKIKLLHTNISDIISMNFNEEIIVDKYNETKQVFFSLINNGLGYNPSTHITDIDDLIRLLIIVCSIYSLYTAYYINHVNRQKDRCDKEVRALLVLEAMRYAEEKVNKDIVDKTNELHEIIEPRLDYMESHLYNMENDLEFLKKMCHQMSERTITFGSLVGATWHTANVYHSDIVTVDYDIVDILTSNIIESKQTQYTCVSIKGILSENAEIKIPPGAKIIVTKATRLYRGIRDLASGYIITSEAKDALETYVIRLPR
jgi:hypothetical protein